MEALPTLILFFKGKVVERYVGYRSADELEKEVRVVSELPAVVICIKFITPHYRKKHFFYFFIYNNVENVCSNCLFEITVSQYNACRF